MSGKAGDPVSIGTFAACYEYDNGSDETNLNGRSVARSLSEVLIRLDLARLLTPLISTAIEYGNHRGFREEVSRRELQFP